MKIGILTFHRGPNHGGYLQAYELCQAVQKLGHQAEIINYQNARHAESERFRPTVYRRPNRLWHAWRKHRAFDEALKDLPMGDFTSEVSEVDWSRYQTILVGADVVWDYSQDRLGKDPIYFGGFRKGYQGTLAAYAPSCGMAVAADGFPEWVTQGLAGFDEIAVRDEATAELAAKATGDLPRLVVDPTWLPIRDERPDPLASAQRRGKYIAVYGFSIDAGTAGEIQRYARSKNLRIIASGYPHSWADRFESSLTPLEWVQHMKNAEAVFCGTFHGALYAIRLGKRFAVLPNDKIRAKLSTPLRLAGLADRWISEPGEIGELLDRAHDHETTLGCLQPTVRDSWEYLENVTGVRVNRKPTTSTV